MPRRLHGMIKMDMEYASRLWGQYVGQQSPQEFMRYSRGKTIREAVDEYIEGLDGMFGEGTAANAPGDLDDALASYIESEIAYSRRNERIGELVSLGLTALEADVIASIEAGESQVSIAARRGISKQTVNKAKRSGINKLAQTKD
jgi:DNA-binding CsgD family transcriptional regulator